MDFGPGTMDPEPDTMDFGPDSEDPASAAAARGPAVVVSAAPAAARRHQTATQPAHHQPQTKGELASGNFTNKKSPRVDVSVCVWGEGWACDIK